MPSVIGAVKAEAEALYTAGTSPRPAWRQLGEVTRSVWYEYAVRKLAGVKDWWSINHTVQGILPTLSRASGVLRHLPPGVMNMDLNNKQVAETLDEIAGLFLKLAGSFRPASGSGGSAGGNAKAGGKKPATKSVEEEQAEHVELTEDDVREKLKDLAASKGRDKMIEALESVGASKLGEVDESQYNELVATIETMMADEEEEAPKPAAKKVAAKKTAKKAGPTLEQVTEAAKALIEADKAAYLKITKKLGKPSEMDESGYAAAITAYEEAMPSGEEELL